VGKSATAAVLGQLWLCEKPAGDQACGQCDACRAFAAQNHPDYHVVTKELIRYHDRTGTSKGISLSIDVIRPELIEPAMRKAFMGRGKVFVIEQADLMTAPAQNALLKTLEAPAGRTLIILLSDDPETLLATIRSRCQVVRFGRLDEATTRGELERRGIDPTTAADAAQAAEDSLGAALKWIADGVIEPARELRGKLDALLAGGESNDLPAFFRRAADAYADKQLQRDELASKDQATREGLNLYLRLAAAHVRLQLAQSADPDRLEHLCCAIDAIARAGIYLDANVNIPIIFQQLSLKLRRHLAQGSPGAPGK